MPSNLRDAQLAATLAEVVVDLLPGAAHPFGDDALSFPAAATAAGVGAFWRGGSKRPALTQLFTRTLAEARPRFCHLVLEIVRRGIAYGTGASRPPLTRDDVDALNAVVAEIGFKIPELHDPAFLGTLPRRATPRGSGNAASDGGSSRPSSDAGPEARASGRRLADAERRALLEELRALATLAPHPRGLAFERVLSACFAAAGLAPRGGFSLRGEQIDGSLQLDGATYLLEAKWTSERTSQPELLVFSGKVNAKAGWARGLFVSYTGYTDVGLEAFARGRATNIVCMDGLDLYHVLDGGLSLPDVLRAKTRLAAETGRAFVPVRELSLGVI